ncbi:urease accessory protein UreE [Corallincola luteus]|uniref:Urease accessory protein UreE n=1 Tax=Corallincola luteus TaxID=1775177 RepID=A0ABY2AJD6_9GAMM|nr:urease accessory protein UreE [Corallincola luteus]TCI02922.1 urease accessory protein UreE [Corallincola luteus]
MLRIIAKHSHPVGELFDQLTLPFSLRQKGRFRASSDAGHDVGVFLPRGEVLMEGDYLVTECGKCFAVKAEAEQVVVARTDCWHTFARACYHLGNRHVPLQVGERWIRFQPDHVLEQMVELLGLTVTAEKAGFTPENGAYAQGLGGHSHGHSHDDDHSHDHSHEHPAETLPVTGHSH